MSSFDFTRDHFALFNLKPTFALDRSHLDSAYRALQAEVHPDRFAHLAEAERRLSLQWATQVNTAFQALKSPLNRARYLLQLNGVDTQEETNTAMPADFLMEQMEWREAIEEHRSTQDINALETLSRRLQKETQALHGVLEQQIDKEHDYNSASLTVRKLKFLEKLDEEISGAIEAALG